VAHSFADKVREGQRQNPENAGFRQLIPFFCEVISVLTETTDNNAITVGSIFYDAECSFCMGWAKRLEQSFARRGFILAPLQTSKQFFGFDEMAVQFSDGRRLGGADAVVALGRYVWWLKPLWLFGTAPGAMTILRAAYRRIAANRGCVDGACSIVRRSRCLDWLPFIVLPVVAIAIRNVFVDWIFMWVLAYSIFLAFKWLTWRRVDRSGVQPIRSLAYLFAWPGMDAHGFLRKTADQRVGTADWVFAALKTLLGATVFWAAATSEWTTAPWACAWIGMWGAILFLHFGVFQLAALGYRSTGIEAASMMRRPLFATSLADFWGNRWNTAFNKLSHDLTFRPLARRFGGEWAAFLVFIVSGLVHDLVISLSAHGGYGLPTFYFAVQGAAVLFERSRLGSAIGLRRGWRGRAYMLAVTAMPAFWLFHPLFINNIIVPMQRAFGGA
jgi:alginate O-acetyltransferase complex protein AlgI